MTFPRFCFRQARARVFYSAISCIQRLLRKRRMKKNVFAFLIAEVWLEHNTHCLCISSICLSQLASATNPRNALNIALYCFCNHLPSANQSGLVQSRTIKGQDPCGNWTRTRLVTFDRYDDLTYFVRSVGYLHQSWISVKMVFTRATESLSEAMKTTRRLSYADHNWCRL